MAPIAGEEKKDAKVFGRVVKSKLRIYSEYEKGSTCGIVNAGSNGSKYVALKKATKGLKAHDSKGPPNENDGRKLDTLIKKHVGRKALADLSNVGRTSNVNAHGGSQPIKKKGSTGTFTRDSRGLALRRRNSSVIISQSSAGKKEASTVCGVGSSHSSSKVNETMVASSSAQVCRNLNNRCTTRSSNQVIRTSLPVFKKLTHVGKSNGKESVECADQDRQKYGFPVKRRVGGMISRSSDYMSKPENNRARDSFIVTDSSALGRRKCKASLTQSLADTRTVKIVNGVYTSQSHISGKVGKTISMRSATSRFQKSKSQDCKNLTDRCRAKTTDQVTRKSYPISRKAKHDVESSAKGNANSADEDKRKFGFIVKKRVSANVMSQASDAKRKLLKDRVSDTSLVKGSRGQRNSNVCEKLKISVKPILRTGLKASKSGRSSKSKSIASLDKSQRGVSSKRDIKVISSVPNSISAGCHEVAKGESKIRGSNNMPNILGVSISKKSGRRKSYTSTLISRSKLMEESAITKLERLSSIDDQTNPLEVAEYVDEIYLYYWAMEVQSASLENPMVNQNEVTPQMRGVLVNWLIEVHDRFDLMQETLYLTIALLDRYLSLVTISQGQMQLVGLTALLLASKYEDFWHPRVKDLISISAETYTTQEVLEMEKEILRTLKFRFNLPTAYVFMLRFLKASQSKTKQLEHLAFYLLELCLVEYEALSFKPSMICAAALYIARCTLNLTPKWTPLLVRHARYQVSQIRDCAEMILRFQKAAKTGLLKVTHEKYKHPDLGKVAVLKPLTCLPI